MSFHDVDVLEVANKFNTNRFSGLSFKAYNDNLVKYGKNVLTKEKGKGIFKKVFSALKEPMLIILIFSFLIAFGTELGKFLKSGEGDFLECGGILLAIVLSVSITLIMEGSSEKAFAALNKIYDNLRVNVIREGQTVTVKQSEIVVGDLILLESGDKVVADGRLIDGNSLSVDESALTGESNAVNKNHNLVLSTVTPLADRKNCLFSGTFVTSGSGKMLVTAVGDNTEIGSIAGALGKDKSEPSPLQIKLNKLGKIISAIGAATAILVFVISIIKLSVIGELSFDNVQSLFISCIVLIVAAVPEGLPTIVAVSLALNMIKLAGENALIKKMTATETAGAVSVICTDKTGTLTENKMKVEKVCANEFCVSPENAYAEVLNQNFVCNSTAEILYKGRKKTQKGSPTECALLESYVKSTKNTNYQELRNAYTIVDRTPFSSDKKMMSTTISIDGKKRMLLKGAPEVVLNKCALTNAQREKILSSIKVYQKKARRVLCFAHADDNGNASFAPLQYDGYVSITDPIRKDVCAAVKYCQKAGIKVKILTGDNAATALAIARELGVAKSEENVISASQIEELSDEQLKKLLPKVSVIARSTPNTKLKVVRLLKSTGEIVAVTGDGINDAPAIKHADVGIAMGISGSEITKEAADVVLLDDSFSTIVKAVSFGRNVYKNLQRFILFQLTVNLSALFFITVCAIIGAKSPFNTFQLLWINVIMDGPPALTLGLERAGKDLLEHAPVKKSSAIVSRTMFIRILFSGLFIGTIMIFQHLYNFLDVLDSERAGTLFTLFILFQLFNAFNCRELGSNGILRRIGKNKIMVITFTGVFLLHLLIVQVAYKPFGVLPLGLSAWVKTVLTAAVIVVISEIVKFVYRHAKDKN